ncbi:MAG: quinone-dependent dihydroorotate dehydrogenase [Sediminibacterium sp.]|nr:quinone-dependent dihydroorotate dehydrogenase [Sediminibacterium sp.]
MIYNIIKKVLFQLEPEKAHKFSMNCLAAFTNFMPKTVMDKIFINQPPNFLKIWDLNFKNEIGLGAGFDKNGEYLHPLSALGFGFLEIGTVTPLAQIGNPTPRLIRLPNDNALINRMGFNNKGMEEIYKNVDKWRQKNIHNIIIGGNIGKNKDTPNELAWQDYVLCFKRLYNVVDYFVVNVSSPNTTNLRELQDKFFLEKILSSLQNINIHNKPILLKIAPDLNEFQITQIIETSQQNKLKGIIACNTSLDRTNLLKSSEAIASKFGHGGLSGKPIKNKATEIISYIKNNSSSLDIIASGGIFTKKDVEEKRTAGAILFQVWTGFIYEGPFIVKKIMAKNNC